MIHILIVGAADTGRAPMATALLTRQAENNQREWHVDSAGVLGHDGDPPETEARTAMSHLGFEIGSHRARSVNDELVAAAALVIAIDSGTAKALRARFPHAAHIHSLGELAKRQRDIPDPFRMQVGAWMTYARELDSLLEQAMPRMRELVGEEPTTGDRREDKKTRRQEDKKSTNNEQQTTNNEQQTTNNEQQTMDNGRSSALARIERLLAVLGDMPEVVHWPAARARIEQELPVATAPLEALDLAAAYGGLLRAALVLSAPTAGQTSALRAAFARLNQPITQDDLAWLSAQIGGWAKL